MNMKKYSLKFVITIFLCMFALQDFSDCFSQPRINHKLHTGNKNIVCTRYGESPLILSVASVALKSCDHVQTHYLQTLTLERKMQDFKREQRFEQERSALTPHQTAAVHALLSVIDKETIQILDDIFLGYLYSDFCDSQSGVERSSTGFLYFAVRSFIVNLTGLERGEVRV